MEESIILVPVLWVIGMLLKRTPFMANWLIPWILMTLGIILANLKMGFSFEAVLQGILVTGVAVLGHQLVKQTTKRD